MKKNLLLLFLLLFTAAGLYAAELNIYASGLNAYWDGNVVKVDYVLNAPATTLSVKLYNGETCVATIPVTGPGNLTKGSHSGVTIDLWGVDAGEYTWSMVASAAANESTVRVPSGYSCTYNTPRGLDVDKDPESPSFGKVYVADAINTANSGSRSGAVYYYPPTLDSRGTFYGGEDDTQLWWAASISSPMRVTVGEDHLLYVTDWSDSQPNIWILDPQNPSSTTKNVVFGGTQSGTAGIYVDESTHAIHGSISHCYVKGSGASRVLYTADEDMLSGVSDYTKGIFSYDIRSLTSVWAAPPSSIVFNNADHYIQNGNNQIWPDGEDGWWMSQNRATDSNEIPAIVHINTSGSVDYQSGPSTVRMDGGTNDKCYNQGAFALNRNKTQMATIRTGYIDVWNISWSQGKPSLAKAYSISTIAAKNLCHSVSFDYAGNIYAAYAGYNIYVYAPTKANNSCETPAKIANKIQVSSASLDLSLNTLYLDQTIEQLSGKTVRRAIVKDGYMFVLALDGSNPYLYRINTRNGEVNELPTDFCSVVNASGLKLSDIALTSDGVLVGCNKEYCGSDAQHPGNDFIIYKWTEDDGVFTGDKWFSTGYTLDGSYSSGFFYNTYTGETMAYVGTSTEGTLVASAVTTGGSTQIRLEIIHINESARASEKYNKFESPILKRSEIGAPLQMNSTAEENVFVLDGVSSKPYKFTIGSDGSILNPTVLVSSVDDAAYTYCFRYDGRDLAVSTHFTSSQNNGFELHEFFESGAAPSVTHDAPALSAVSATFAAAVGETVNDEAYIYVLRDDKLSVYTTSNAYARTGLTPGNVSTICLPYAVNAEDIWGAEIYNVGHVNGSPMSSISLVQEEDDLIAGKPYFILPTKNTIACIYADDVEEDDVQPANGLVGKLSDVPEYVPNNGNCYILSNGQLWYMTSKLENVIEFKQYRAYFDLREYTDPGSSSEAPGRKTLTIPAAQTTPTGLENTEDGEGVKKFVRNGQIYILRDGVTYDALGRVIK